MPMAMLPLLFALLGVTFDEMATRPEAWLRSPEGAAVIENVLARQTFSGSWPKNTDNTQPLDAESPDDMTGTFDNKATTGEVRFLARAAALTSDERCKRAVIRALDHILTAQYPSGGWPQSAPPDFRYHRHITFNDGTMVRLLELLRDVPRGSDFAWVDHTRRALCGAAFFRGIDCIVRSQVRVNGELTAWCAQHDAVDLTPQAGRAFELVSLSGGESSGILKLLMSLDAPSPEVVRAVHAGARWYEKVKLTGIRIEKVNGDKTVVPDPDAPPLWARFYEIETNRPFFCGRDGVKRFDIAEIERERRNGYGWYGNWGATTLKRYEKWSKQWPER
jgi:pectate lyase